MRNHGPNSDLDSFTRHLLKSKRILALCGAGLSAASGLPTFRGAGGYWRKHKSTSLATPAAWKRDPSLVWQFYSYRRHAALKAVPNAAHHALARLSSAMEHNFLTISQNVDGLSQRARHPTKHIEYIHGSLFNVRCNNAKCNNIDDNNFIDPISPALKIEVIDGVEPDLSTADVPMKSLLNAELPQCHLCGSLIRPGVVWFGESLPETALSNIEEFFENGQGIDTMFVIGTSALVYPAAGYISRAKLRGARIVVINTEAPTTEASNLSSDDWLFLGDAGTVVPRILEPLLSQLDVL